jgi:hypothetical protein
MKEKNQVFFKLLKYWIDLKENKKSLFIEDPKKSRKLSEFLVIIEENLHLRERNKYIKLLEIFLNKKISTEDFSFCFIAQYDSINQILREMKQDFEKNFDELSNLLIENPNKKYEIGMSLMLMYDLCDDYNPNDPSSITVEENLKNSAVILLSELKRT